MDEIKFTIENKRIKIFILFTHDNECGGWIELRSIATAFTLTDNLGEYEYSST